MSARPSALKSAAAVASRCPEVLKLATSSGGLKPPHPGSGAGIEIAVSVEMIALPGVESGVAGDGPQAIRFKKVTTSVVPR